jgi:hypothetical protein
MVIQLPEKKFSYAPVFEGVEGKLISLIFKLERVIVYFLEQMFLAIQKYLSVVNPTGSLHYKEIFQ